MYTFQDAHGNTMVVKFHHHKSKGKAPKSTTCIIFRMNEAGERELVSQGFSKVVSEFPVIMTPEEVKMLYIAKGARPKRVYRTDDGQAIAIMPADRFCYARARKESFKKAITFADRETRKNGWAALLAAPHI